MSPAGNTKVVNNVRGVTTKSKWPVDETFAEAVADAVRQDDVQDTVLVSSTSLKAKRKAYIPDQSYADRYVGRKIKGVQDFDIVALAIKKKKNILLRGDTGAGKTLMGMAYAAKFKLPYYSVPCDVALDSTSLFGKMMPTDHIGEFEWVDGPVTEFVRYGGILNISEINFMSPKVSASLFGLLDRRRVLTLLGHRGEVIKAHPKLVVIADMNPRYRGTVDLNAAFANRFNIKIDWDYDPAVESSLIKSPSLLTVVRNIRKLSEIKTPVGTNVMEEFLDLAPHLGYDFAVMNFVGQFDATERDAVMKVFLIQQSNIKSELATIKAGSTLDEDMEEVEADEEWFKEEGDLADFEWGEDE